jgi:hypothetical protein
MARRVGSHVAASTSAVIATATRSAAATDTVIAMGKYRENPHPTSSVSGSAMSAPTPSCLRGETGCTGVESCGFQNVTALEASKPVSCPA